MPVNYDYDWETLHKERKRQIQHIILVRIKHEIMYPPRMQKNI